MSKENYKTVVRHMIIYDLEGPIETLSERLKNFAVGLEEPRLTIDCGYDYTEASVMGLVPLTPEEMRKAEEKRAREKEKAKATEKAKQVTRITRLLNEAKALGFTVIESEPGE